jgi:hypothetical protein
MKINNFLNWNIILYTIIAIAFLLRMTALGGITNNFNPDEAAIFLPSGEPILGYLIVGNSK